MANYIDDGLRKFGIAISKPLLAMVCIISGMMVILLPNFLVLIVGLFLIIQGAFLFTDYYEQESRTPPTTTPQGVYCHKCGARNTQEAVYCKACGEKLFQAGQIVVAQPQEAIQ
jgi:hypothetical protein